jgi:Kef-type K+ transport system membrane component KefB
MRERLFAAGVGFLLGDLIIGVITWFIYCLFTNKWESSSPFRFTIGIVFAIIGFLMGERFIYPLFDLIEKIDKKRKRSQK